MFTINSVLFGILGGLITFKVILLAIAGLLLVNEIRRRAELARLEALRIPARRPRLDVRV